jgi:DNA-binding PadR family transcriptional regulator
MYHCKNYNAMHYSGEGGGEGSLPRKETHRMAVDDAALEALLPLSPPVYHVLLALGRETMHGYAIMQAFDELTDGQEQLLPGTLYATLRRMVEGALLEEVEPPAPDGDARRRYYRVTDRGREVAAAETARMRRLLDVAEARRLVEETP